MYKITLFATLLIIFFGFSGFADEKEKNNDICEKEYTNEPIERTACKLAGESDPQTRDCLIKERHETGHRGEQDTRKAEIERHLKCWESEHTFQRLFERITK